MDERWTRSGGSEEHSSVPRYSMFVRDARAGRGREEREEPWRERVRREAHAAMAGSRERRGL